MTKEKIIEMILSQDGTPNGTFITLDVLRCECIADELISLIEQEKKETAKEIFEKLLNAKIRQGPIYISKNFIDIAKEYGVEL